MYPQSFREKVILALSNGRSIRRTASDFSISTNTVRRWKENISTVKDDQRGRTGKINKEELLKDVEMYPDDYQHERAERFNCSVRGICRCLKRLNISKKNCQAS